MGAWLSSLCLAVGGLGAVGFWWVEEGGGLRSCGPSKNRCLDSYDAGLTWKTKDTLRKQEWPGTTSYTTHVFRAAMGSDGRSVGPVRSFSVRCKAG